MLSEKKPEYYIDGNLNSYEMRHSVQEKLLVVSAILPRVPTGKMENSCPNID